MSSNAIESAQSTEDASQEISSQKVQSQLLDNETAASLNNASSANGRSVNERPASGSSANTGDPSAASFKKLVSTLSDKRLKKQLQAIRSLADMGETGESALAEFVRDRMSAQTTAEPTAAHGSAYQMLYRAHSSAAKALIEEFPQGLVCPQSDKDMDYSDLQMLLVKQAYQEADKLTNQKLCALAGESAVERKWVYFTEVSNIPSIDLQAIDIIWGLYSEDKFGWSKQRDLWMRLGQDWERLWLQLQWKSAGGVWTRYPNEFVWELASAPAAHLPLSNQLRGVRTMDSLFAHPVWRFPWQPE